jgi:hypothetical protein
MPLTWAALGTAGQRWGPLSGPLSFSRDRCRRWHLFADATTAAPAPPQEAGPDAHKPPPRVRQRGDPSRDPAAWLAGGAAAPAPAFTFGSAGAGLVEEFLGRALTFAGEISGGPVLDINFVGPGWVSRFRSRWLSDGDDVAGALAEVPADAREGEPEDFPDVAAHGPELSFPAGGAGMGTVARRQVPRCRRQRTRAGRLPTRASWAALLSWRAPRGAVLGNRAQAPLLFAKKFFRGPPANPI